MESEKPPRPLPAPSFPPGPQPGGLTRWLDELGWEGSPAAYKESSQNFRRICVELIVQI